VKNYTEIKKRRNSAGRQIFYTENPLLMTPEKLGKLNKKS
jgi:hypothetical protein